MKVKIRSDHVEIEGYVNAVERDSKPLRDRIGQFIERICKGAFARAISRNDDVHILLNHDWARDLGSTKKGNLKLHEDSIGLFARATISDPEVIKKARAGDLVGWSFGFEDRDVEKREKDGMPYRAVKDLDLYEVSILDKTKSPAYEGTLIAARDADKPYNVGETMIADFEISEETNTREENPVEDSEEKEIDYSEYEKMIAEMKGE